MITAVQVKAVAGRTSPLADRQGCVWLTPSVKLRCTEAVEDIAVGEIVHANKLDETGKYPNTVHLEANIRWWPLSCFELAPAEG